MSVRENLFPVRWWRSLALMRSQLSSKNLRKNLSIKDFRNYVKARQLLRRSRARAKSIARSGQLQWQDIPVIINNRDRLTYLSKLIGWLETAGMRNIIILDNASTYPPLLSYYDEMPHRLIRFENNLGHLALWRSGVFEAFKNNYYIYTDPDILPDDQCPRDAVRHFFSILQKYPSVAKAGFGLRIDDIPPEYPLREKVLRWEQRFWNRACGPGLFVAPIDTTFALYPPCMKPAPYLPCIRTGAPYLARHLPWYHAPEDLPVDEQYYRSRIAEDSTWWSGNNSLRDSGLAEEMDRTVR